MFSHYAHITAVSLLALSSLSISTSAFADEIFPSIAHAEHTERYLVVWQDRNGPLRIRGVLLDVFGQPVSSTIDLDELAFPGLVSGPEVASDGHDFLVAWGRDPNAQNDYEVHAQVVTSQGRPRASTPIVVAPSGQTVFSLDVAYEHSSGRFLVVYEKNGPKTSITSVANSSTGNVCP